MSGGAYPCQPGCMCRRHNRAPSDYRKTGRKTCTKCGEEKDLGAFDVAYQGKRGPVLQARCKPCRYEDMRPNLRKGNLARAYGISLEEYDELLKSQSGVCAICGEPEWVTQYGKLRMLCVDHDHLSGKVRGLLCSNCNRAIGLLNDDVDTLKKAIHYLQSGAGYSE